jgi:hypothetical protein
MLISITVSFFIASINISNHLQAVLSATLFISASEQSLPRIASIDIILTAVFSVSKYLAIVLQRFGDAYHRDVFKYSLTANST